MATTKSAPKADEKAVMTKEDAAKFVFRRVPKMKDGEPVLNDEGDPELESTPVPADEVMSFKDYGDHVVIVTTAGEKLRGDKK